MNQVQPATIESVKSSVSHQHHSAQTPIDYFGVNWNAPLELDKMC